MAPPEFSRQRGSGLVLVADDEKIVRESMQALFESAGFAVVTAADGREAVRTYGEHRGRVVCVVLDLTMPVMGGDEVFREIRRIDPAARVVLTSGYPEEEMSKRFAGQEVFGFVQKPEPIDRIIARLHEALTSGT